jgi:FkbM family methyltransferase
MASFTPVYRANSSDEVIWNEVFFGDCYQIPELGQNDMVIDVGAHTGAFICACLRKGAKNLIAFEPDTESFALAKQNLTNYTASVDSTHDVVLKNLAVWRSDAQEQLMLSKVRFSELTNSMHFAAQSTLFKDAESYSVESVGLDSVLNPFSEVRLLKLDCEGAEWPILFTCTQLAKVRRLSMEVHSLAWKSHELSRAMPYDLNREFGRYSFNDLKAHLQRSGLNVKAEGTCSGLSGAAEFIIGTLFERP